MTEIVHADSVFRHFGAVTALDGISVSVSQGERIALVGHNGAGKTTLIKLILGLLRPTKGRLTVAGFEPGSAGARAATAYLPESLAFHPALTGREQLRFLARLRGTGDPVGALLDRVGLGAAADRRIGTYSKGMRQRLGLAQLLLGNPRLVVLDEPTTGLDPVSRHQFYEILEDLAKQGIAIIQTSHVLTELEARTDRIVILRDGIIAADGSLAALRQALNLPIRLRVRAAAGKSAAIRQQLGGREVNGRTVEIEVSPSQKMNRIREIAGQGPGIDDFEILQPSLEELYLHYSRDGTQHGSQQ